MLDSRAVPDKTSYRDAGVNIDAKDESLREVRRIARGTFTPDVVSDIGLFGGLFRANFGGMDSPILVSSTDGVGTKLRVAQAMKIHDTVGYDLVCHCVNDILVQGARPLFFLDYYATGRLRPKVMTDVVRGMARACSENGCALIGGETAEMPGFYGDDDYDIAGFIAGALDAKIRLGTWPVLPIFKFLVQKGEIERDEMLRVFNMGIGMVVIVAPDKVDVVSKHFAQIGQQFFFIGNVVRGAGKVVYDVPP